MGKPGRPSTRVPGDPGIFYKGEKLKKELAKKRKDMGPEVLERLAEARKHRNDGSEEFEKDAVPKRAYRMFATTISIDSYTWLHATAIEKNTSMGMVIDELVRCAAKGKVFFLNRQWTRLERKFYERELQRQMRVEALNHDREKARGRLLMADGKEFRIEDFEPEHRKNK